MLLTSAVISSIADALIDRKLIKHRLIKITTVVKGQKAVAYRCLQHFPLTTKCSCKSKVPAENGWVKCIKQEHDQGLDEQIWTRNPLTCSCSPQATLNISSSYVSIRKFMIVNLIFNMSFVCLICRNQVTPYMAPNQYLLWVLSCFLHPQETMHNSILHEPIYHSFFKYNPPHKKPCSTG